MKRCMVLLTMCFAVSVLTGLLYAQDEAMNMTRADEPTMSMPAGGGMMSGMKGDMMGKGGMHAMMMGKMMEKTMVPTKDGGVIILVGNRLLKYDQDLNLKKEVEIKMPCSEEMKKRMKDCPMMGKMASESEQKSPEGLPASSGAAEQKG